MGASKNIPFLGSISCVLNRRSGMLENNTKKSDYLAYQLASLYFCHLIVESSESKQSAIDFKYLCLSYK
jgi:hypothetical protein